MGIEFRGLEGFYVTAISVISLVVVLRNLFSKNIYAIWGVNNMLMVSVLYYGIVGPLISLYNNDTYLRLLDHRPYFETAWQGLLVFLICYLIGYNLIKSPKNELLPSLTEIENDSIVKVKKSFYYLFIIGFFCVFLLQGKGIFSSLSFWEKNTDKEALYSGGFIGYVINGMNLLIVGVPMIIYLWRLKRISKIQALSFLFIAFAVFTAAGFRYRLVVAGFAGLGMYYISLQKRIKVLPVALLAIAFIAYMGVLEVSRSYGRGLNLSKAQSNTFSDNVLLGFNESAVFMATGLIMERSGVGFDFIGLDPVIQSIVTPIPRFMWKSKPTGNYLININKSYAFATSSSLNRGNGQAILNYGEYYMSYGWAGVVGFGFLLGLLLGKLNTSALKQIHNPWMLCFYLLNASYAYVIFSRGYMPQQTMLYFFTVYPAYYLAKKLAKKENHRLQSNLENPQTHR